MNSIKKKLVLLVSIFSIAIIGMGFSQKDTYAKDYTGKLESGRTYRINLDKKGKKEKLRLDYKWKENDDSWYILYINGKRVLTTINNGDVEIYVLDTNKKDKQMEIFVVKGMDYFSIKYYKYKSSKLKKIQDLTSIVKKSIKILIISIY